MISIKGKRLNGSCLDNGIEQCSEWIQAQTHRLTLKLTQGWKADVDNDAEHSGYFRGWIGGHPASSNLASRPGARWNESLIRSTWHFREERLMPERKKSEMADGW